MAKKEIKENNIMNMAFSNTKESIEEQLDNKQTTNNEETKKGKNFFTELSLLAFDYIDFKSKVKGVLKKEIVEEIIRKDMIDSFGLSENATEKDLQLAFDEKKNVLAKMQNIFK